jgi:hypothetical protein
MKYFNSDGHSSLPRDMDEISVMTSLNSELTGPPETAAIRDGHMSCKSDILLAVLWFFSSHS